MRLPWEVGSSRRIGWRVRRCGLRHLAAGGIGVAVGLTLLAGPGEAQERERREAPQQGAPAAEERAEAPSRALVDRFAARVGQALDLDRSQRERLAAELQRSRRERAALVQRRREVTRELARIVRSGTADRAGAAGLLEELLELRVELARIEVEENRRLSEFMTPVQRARLYHLKRRLAERALDARRQGGNRRR